MRIHKGIILATRAPKNIHKTKGKVNEITFQTRTNSILILFLAEKKSLTQAKLKYSLQKKSLFHFY